MLVKVGAYISGGWLQAPWPTAATGYFTSEQACIFTLANPSSPAKLSVKVAQRAGCLLQGYWALGGGPDLGIVNNANTNTNNFSNLGHSYTLPTGLTYGNDNAKTFLFGTSHFTPNEVEVFCEM